MSTHCNQLPIGTNQVRRAVSYSLVIAGPEKIARCSLGHMEGYAKVNDFNASVLSGHHDVFRLQVAVDDPQVAHMVKC